MPNSKEETVWSVSAGKLSSASTKLWNELGENGNRIIIQLDDDIIYRKKISDFMLSGGIIPSADQKLVRYIMGNNFFGPDDWAKFYGVNFPQKQLHRILEIPCSEEVLLSTCPLCGKTIKDCSFMFLGLSKIKNLETKVENPFTIMQWHKLHPPTGQPKFYFGENPWHKGQPYTDITTLEFRWYLLHKEILPDSTSKTPEDQAKMLTSDYEIPTTITEVTKDLLIFRKTGERPNYSKYAACTERTVKTDKVFADHVSCVGNFNGNGLDVSSWYGSCHSIVGVGASRKF